MLAAPPVTPASDIKSRVVRWCLNMREPSGAVNHTSSAWLPLVEMKRAPTQCCRHRLPSGWTTRPTINMCCKENYLRPSLNTFSDEKCSVHVVRVLHCFSPLPSAPYLILQHPLNTVDTTRHLSTSILHFRLQAKEKFECVKPGPRGRCSPRCCEFSTLLFYFEMTTVSQRFWNCFLVSFVVMFSYLRFQKIAIVTACLCSLLANIFLALAVRLRDTWPKNWRRSATQAPCVSQCVWRLDIHVDSLAV